MMEFRDYYATLGVTKTASEAEIKKAFRRLAREHHPDLNPGNTAAEARFKEINEAYEVLGDADKRRKYDELGANWKMYEQGAPAGAAGGSGWSPFGGGSGGGAGGRASYRTMTPDEMEAMFGGQDPFSDFFHTFFSGGPVEGSARSAGRGGTRRARRTAEPAPPPPDQPVDLTLEEVLNGANRRLMISSNGTSDTVDVRIPAGVKEGARIRVAGKDGRGDLFLKVQVAAHGVFERRGQDLYMRARVPVTTAVLGGEVVVPTLSGSTLRLKVPESTPAGRVFRLRGHGLPAVGNAVRGDLYATVDLQLPAALSPEAREHYEALRALEDAAEKGPSSS